MATTNKRKILTMEKEMEKKMITLETLIQKRAEKRLKETMQEFAKVSSNDPILRKLKIKLENFEDGKQNTLEFINSNGSYYYALFNGSKTARADVLTNINEIKEELLKEYIEEETADILNKLDNIQYLFDKE